MTSNADDCGPIERIVIVGGGTAGWLSAAYLNQALKGNVNITVVESNTIGAIGVGEATIPSLRVTMGFLGFRDPDWMPQVGATYKSAIKFVNWCSSGRDGTAHEYWHPFIARPEPSVLPYRCPFAMAIGERVSLLHYALKKRLDGDSRAIQQLLLPTQSLCEDNKAPVNPSMPEISQEYAFHLDAARLGAFLRQVAKTRGVEQVVDHVTDVKRAENGFITALETKKGKRLSADLFIDCSGFRGILLNDTLGEPFESDDKHLLCDSAVALSAPSDPERHGIHPYTTATALDHGWCWDIPLMHRRGCGYVYSSKTTTATDAESELRQFLGSECEGSEASQIKMRVGRTRNAWVKNCVGIGLSSGFIEPLESTGIALLEAGLAGLVALFPDKRCDAAVARVYNAEMRAIYEETRDFIVLHYVLSNRRDTDFWNAVANDTEVPDSLVEKRAFFKNSLPLLDDLRFSVFRAFNYTCILDGCDHLPSVPYPLVEHIGYGEGHALLNEITKKNESIASSMPDHYTLLKHMAVSQ